MSESSITPLAQRLAEENNVDWAALQGSGPEGRIIERDVLEYLARVMAGEEDLNPTPEPLPDGLESWESFAAPQETDSWFAPPQADAAAEPAADSVAGELSVTDAPAPDTDAQDSSAEAEFELSDDIFLFDEDEPEAFDLFGGTPQAAADDTAGGDTAEGDTAADAAGFLDDDFYEDDFLTDLALEDGELDAPEAADADLSGFGMLGDGPAAAVQHDDAEIDLLGDSFSDDLWTAESPVEQDSGWPTGAATEPAHRSLADYLNEDYLNEDALDDGALDDGALDDGTSAADSLQFGLEAADDDAELDLLTGFASPATGEDQLIVDDPVLSEEAYAAADPFVPEESHLAAEADGEDSFEVDFSELSPTVHDSAGEGLSGPAAALAAIPLVSHGALLRRHADLTLLVQARQAAGAELRQGEPVSALPFLVRAAARSAHLLDAAADGSRITGAAIISGHGVQVELVSDAADGRFADLIRLLAASEDPRPGQDGADAGGATVIACDMSQLQLDEAVLHLGSPLLTLGRVLSDSEQGTYHSTLTLSGTFDVAAGARFLQSVSELLASPVRLLI